MLQFQLVTKWAEKGDEAWVGGGGECGNERRNRHTSVAFNFNGQFGCSLGFGHVHFVCNIH